MAECYTANFLYNCIEAFSFAKANSSASPIVMVHLPYKFFYFPGVILLLVETRINDKLVPKMPLAGFERIVVSGWLGLMNFKVFAGKAYFLILQVEIPRSWYKPHQPIAAVKSKPAATTAQIQHFQ